MTVRRAPQLQRPVHILLKGDKPKANQWLPWAKKKLHTLERYHVGYSGKSFGTKAYVVESGFNTQVVVFIKAVKDQKWIIIEAEEGPPLYMESGILDHRTTAPLNEDAWLPSILNYGAEIKAIRGPNAALGELVVEEVADNQLDGENRGEGDSEAIGCPKSEKLREHSVTIPTFFSGTKHKVFTSEVPKFCEDILILKYWQQQRPPSMWSGKMRQMIQAIYGSKRTDYFINVSRTPNALAFDALQLKHGSLGWRFGESASLYSGRNHEYFVIYLGTDGIKARALTPSPAGKALQQYLNDNPDLPADRYREYETYLLSTLYFTEADRTPIKIGEPRELFQHGGGLGRYGASWNWKGDTGYIATMNSYVDGTTSTHSAALHRISISERDLAETLEEGRLTAATVVEEGPTNFTLRVNEDIIWTPDWINGGLNLFLSQADAFDSPAHEDTDVPLKVVYNYDDDDFDLIRFKREDLGSGDGSFGEAGNWTNTSDETEPGCDSTFCGFASDSDGGLEVGFYVTNLGSGQDHEDNMSLGKEGQNVALRSLEAGITSENTRQGGASSKNERIPGLCDDTPTIPGDYFFTPWFSMCSGGALHIDGDFLFESVLMIPFYDVDAVYLAARRSVAGDIRTEKITSDVEMFSGVQIFDWDTGEALSGILRAGIVWFHPTGLPGAPAGGIKGKARDQEDPPKYALFEGTAEYNDIQVQHFFNGEFHEAHLARTVDEGGAVNAMYIPGCFGADADIPSFDGGDWEEGEANFGGYKTHFDPQYFFGTDSAQAVYSQTSANHGSYAATGKNGGSATQIDDGSYNFDNISPFFTWVGFA